MIWAHEAPYNAACDGVAPDADAIQAAWDAACAVREPLWVRGRPRLEKPVVRNTGGVLRGMGAAGSVTIGIGNYGTEFIVDPGVSPFMVDTDYPVIMEDFAVTGNSVGDAITLTSTVDPLKINVGSHIERLYIRGFNRQVAILSGANFKVEDNVFESFVTAGVFARCAQNNDAGDAVIANNDFSSATQTGAGILHANGGGLKVIGNKVNGPHAGYWLDFDSNAHTGGLNVTGNNFENVFAGIKLSRKAGGTKTYRTMNLTGNNLIGKCGVWAPTCPESWLGNVCIDNAVTLMGAPSANTANSLDGIAVFNLGGTCDGHAGCYPFDIGSKCSDGTIRIQALHSFNAGVVRPGAQRIRAVTTHLLSAQ